MGVPVRPNTLNMPKSASAPPLRVCVTEADETCDSMTCVSHRAAYNGDVQQLEALLKAGMLSLDHRDQLGSTLLHKGKDVGVEETYERRRVASLTASSIYSRNIIQ